MPCRPITVWQIGAGGFVSGYGSRNFVVRAGCRNPMWSSEQGAWCVAPQRLADVMARAAHDGRHVIWRGEIAE